MSNVIQFRPKAAYPDLKPEREPTFTIEVYDSPGDDGFQWYCNSDAPIDHDRLQDYVGDMFMSMLPEEDRRPGILERAGKFIHRILNLIGDDQ